MATTNQTHGAKLTDDDGRTESGPSGYAAISPLELRRRREWNAARDERIAMSLELARARYLLKRIANWTPYPIEDAEHEARMFLKMYDHHPAEWGEQERLL